jgi:hypothetical protein
VRVSECQPEAELAGIGPQNDGSAKHGQAKHAPAKHGSVKLMAQESVDPAFVQPSAGLSNCRSSIRTKACERRRANPSYNME